MRGPGTSVAADKTREPALDAHLLRAVALRLVIAVGRIEPDHVALAPERLERGFLVVDERDHDLSLARGVHFADQREVAVENAFIDHRIPGDFERIMFARPQER